MPHSRPMPSVGKGCSELRVKGEDGAYRVFYYLKIENEVIVFHAFKKKTQQTALKDIDLGKKNLKDML
jgi:phage-related protein